MKIRVKFGKHGYMKFVGHLDIMRFFQKANRMAGIDICYSEGFSPHQKMSFAAPLGVGLQSTGEYVDMEVNSSMTSREAVEKYNSIMVEGINVYSYRRLPDNADNAMSIVAAADYLITFKTDRLFDKIDILKEKIFEFYNHESIEILKKTKKSEKLADIKPLIYFIDVTSDISDIISDDDTATFGIKLQLATGSVNNLKPELVIEAFCNFLNVNFSENPINIYRLEVYADVGDESERKLITLEDLGEEIV